MDYMKSTSIKQCDLQTDGPLWVLVALITIAAIFVIPLIRRMVVVQSEARHVNVMDGGEFMPFKNHKYKIM